MAETEVTHDGGGHTKRCRGITYPESYITKCTTFTGNQSRISPSMQDILSSRARLVLNVWSRPRMCKAICLVSLSSSATVVDFLPQKPRMVDARLLGTGNSNFQGARPVPLIV